MPAGPVHHRDQVEKAIRKWASATESASSDASPSASLILARWRLLIAFMLI